MAQSNYPGASGSTRPGSTSQRPQDRYSETVRSGIHGAEGVAERVMEQGREVSEGMQQVAGNFKTAVDRSIKDQPMATLAVAGVVGFVLGAIWKA